MLMFHLLAIPIFNGVIHAKNISFITRLSKGRIALPNRMVSTILSRRKGVSKVTRDMTSNSAFVHPEKFHPYVGWMYGWDWLS